MANSWTTLWGRGTVGSVGSALALVAMACSHASTPGVPTGTAGEVCTVGAPAPIQASVAPVVSPLDLSIAVANPSGTFGIAAQGKSGDFIVGVLDGSSNAYLVRYHVDGSLDTSFGTQGVLQLSLQNYVPKLAVLESGSIVVFSGVGVGRPDPTMLPGKGEASILRLDANGAHAAAMTLEFPAGSDAVIDDWAIAADGSIVLAIEDQSDSTAPTGPRILTDYYIARLDPSGALDASFGSGGKTQVPGFDGRFAPPSLGLEADGAVLLAARNGEYDCAPNVGCPPTEWFAATRLTKTGQLDTTFANVKTDPTSRDHFDHALTLSSGKVLALGALWSTNPSDLLNGCSRFLVERWNADGTRDESFGASGDFVDDAPSCLLAFQSRFASHAAFAEDAHGGVVVAGQLGTDPAIYRIDACGARDSSFGAQGRAVVHVDPAFTPARSPKASSGTQAMLQEIAALPDGHVVATGTTAEGCGDCNIVPKVFVVRVDANGAPDSGFPAR
jgi:uncharacterized delta-60 repeat protein